MDIENITTIKIKNSMVDIKNTMDKKTSEKQDVLAIF